MRRTLTTWDPWRDLAEIQSEMTRLLQPRRWAQFSSRNESPAVNVWQADDGVIVTAELPGLSPEKLDITVVKDTVTLKGQPQPEEPQQGETFRRRERSHEPFARTVKLPFEVDPQQTQATYEKGVLTVRMRRPEQQQPRKVPITAG